MELFDSIEEVATHLRSELEDKKTILIFAHNGIGKTRLSMEFKEQGRKEDKRDTLYFNAFTEDLFTWDNDFEKGNDSEYTLQMNMASRFFSGLKKGFAMESLIRPLLDRYVDFDFRIDTDEWAVRFSRGESDNIKISRGEENIFIWCFFLAIAQLALDQ